MKKLLLLLVLAGVVSSCRTDQVTELVYPRRIPSQIVPLDRDTIPFFDANTGLYAPIAGTITEGRTMYVQSDLFVETGDSLILEPGVKLIMLGNHAIYINGTLISEGSKEKPVEITIDAIRKANPEFAQGGAWGGINVDSAKAMVLRWTKIEYAGGPDEGNSPRYAVKCINDAIQPCIIEDCWISYSFDDGMRFYGVKNLSVQRNHFIRNGGPEGEALNIQKGVTGIIAYNVFVSSATNCMKVYTDATVLNPQTDIAIVNNTFVNTGYRRTQKTGNAILLDRWARARIYNNLFINCRQSLRITNAVDKQNVHYGHNLFFANIDNPTWQANTVNRFYPAGDFGSPQNTDLINTDPIVELLETNFENIQNNNMAPLISNVRLRLNSPARGTGNPNYDNDMGAYTSSLNSNQH